MRETAEVLCEILDACEKGLKSLPPRNKYGPGGLKNKGIMMREKLAMQELKLQKRKDKKFYKDNAEWKAQLTARDEERQKLLEEGRPQRIADNKKRREDRKRRYEQIVKHNEDRLKEKEENLKRQVEEYKEREKEERLANKDKVEKWKEAHEEFLQKQKEKLEKEMEAIVKERRELDRLKEEFKVKEKETMSKVRNQVQKYFEKNKEKLYFDKKEKQEVNRFLEKPKVKELFETYDVPLRYLFQFYSKSEHHEISFTLDRNMQTMNYKEFIRFGYQSNIVPALIPVEEMSHTFRLLVRERQDENDDAKLQVLDYGFFIKGLIRISAIAQDYLGGQKGQKLEQRMQEIEKEKQKTIKLKKSLAKKFATPRKGSDNSLEREKGGETSGNETGKESQKSEAELYKRGAKKARKKIIKDGYKDQTLKNATILKDVVSEAELLKRKSKNVNMILKEGTRAEIFDHLQKVKVEDKRVTRSVDVGLITNLTIEGLLNYLQLLPEDDKYSLDKKLNKVVRYNTGVKPNRIIKKFKPKKIDAVEGSDDDDGESSPGPNDKSRTEKTDKTDKTDDEDDDDDDGKTGDS